MKTQNQNSMKTIVTMILLLVAVGVYAQPGGPGGTGGGQGQGGPPPAVPIDGGVLVLVAGAALYGRKKMQAYRTEPGEVTK